MVKGDTAIEATERFKVVLSAPSGATLTGTSVSGYIQNDDASSGVGLAGERLGRRGQHR